MKPPKIFRGPYGSSTAHALVVLFGPAAFPGAVYFIRTTYSWVWLVGSGITLVWYWIREYRQTGLVAKLPFANESYVGTDGLKHYRAVPRTFGQRYVTWLNVLFPTFAYGLQLGLLHWFW